MTVVLVEDHASYRESFRLATTSLTKFEVIGEAGTSREAFALIESKLPDLAVVDFLLPDSNGLSLARELKRRRVRTKTLILGRMAHPLFIEDAMRSGVGGFALKQEPLADIFEAMQRVGAGEHYLSPHLQEELASHLSEKMPGLAQLSAREREILFLLIEGLSSKEIAKSLFLSSKTVDAHRLHINRKLGVRSPAGLARLVADQGLLTV